MCHTPGILVVGADMFLWENKMLYIVDYYSTFSIVKKADCLLTDDLGDAAKIIYAEFGLPKKLISDTVMNFVWDTFSQFLR